MKISLKSLLSAVIQIKLITVGVKKKSNLFLLYILWSSWVEASSGNFTKFLNKNDIQNCDANYEIFSNKFSWFYFFADFSWSLILVSTGFNFFSIASCPFSFFNHFNHFWHELSTKSLIFLFDINWIFLWFLPLVEKRETNFKVHRGFEWKNSMIQVNKVPLIKITIIGVWLNWI